MNRKVTATAHSAKLGFVCAELHWRSPSTFVITAKEEAELRSQKHMITVTGAEDTDEALSPKTVKSNAPVAPQPKPVEKKPEPIDGAKALAMLGELGEGLRVLSQGLDKAHSRINDLEAQVAELKGASAKKAAAPAKPAEQAAPEKK